MRCYLNQKKDQKEDEIKEIEKQIKNLENKLPPAVVNKGGPQVRWVSWGAQG